MLSQQNNFKYNKCLYNLEYLLNKIILFLKIFSLIFIDEYFILYCRIYRDNKLKKHKSLLICKIN